MATAAINWEAVEGRVLAELRQRGAIRPTDLLKYVADGYSDAVIKEGVLRLLQEQSIRLTPDQLLELIERAA